MLNIQNLQAGYDGKAVAAIDNFTLAAGENALILGKSGSGKTTLLYAIAGLLQPITGEISLAGTSLIPMSDSFRGRHIGIIYQTLHMVAALSIMDNLLLAQYSAGLVQDAQKAQSLLGRLGIDDLRDRKPETLSQGQQQRAAIARAAMNDPKIILGDEPTAALDDESCDAVMHLLLDTAKAANASLIIATHDARIRKYFPKTITLGGLQ